MARVHLVTVVGGNASLLPRQLDYYRQLGVDECLVNVHCATSQDPVLDQVREIARKFEATIAGVAVGPWLLTVNPALYANCRAARPEDWYVLADQDEFHVYGADIHDICAECDARNVRYVAGAFIDRVSADGSLAPIKSSDLAAEFPLGGWISYPLFGATPNKIVAVKGTAGVCSGQHWPDPLAADVCPAHTAFVQVHHFKWTAGLLERLRRRVEVRRGHGQAYWQESQKVIDYFNRHRDRFDLQDPRLFIAPCLKGYAPWEIVRELARRVAERHYSRAGAAAPFFAPEMEECRAL